MGRGGRGRRDQSAAAAAAGRVPVTGVAAWLRARGGGHAERCSRRKTAEIAPLGRSGQARLNRAFARREHLLAFITLLTLSILAETLHSLNATARRLRGTEQVREHRGAAQEHRARLPTSSLACFALRCGDVCVSPAHSSSADRTTPLLTDRCRSAQRRIALADASHDEHATTAVAAATRWSDPHAHTAAATERRDRRLQHRPVSAGKISDRSIAVRACCCEQLAPIL